MARPYELVATHHARWEAAVTLRSIPRKSAISGLMHAIYDRHRDPGGFIAGLCAAALSAIGMEAIDNLLLGLKFPQSQGAVQTGLCWMGSDAVEPLSRFLQGDNEITSKLCALDVLVAINSGPSRHAAELWLLTSGLRHDTPYARRHSAIVAKHLMSEKCVPLLTNLIHDHASATSYPFKAQTVSEAAIAALKSINTEAAREALTSCGFTSDSNLIDDASTFFRH